MRITSIHVEGFGSLRERLVDTDSSITLFYGANEAGKSTLMGFVRAVLFGFPTRSSRVDRYDPVSGGVHGGALLLRDEQGHCIRVERYDASGVGGRRASAGLVKVTLGDGTTGGEELLNTLLGGLSADLFRSLFAFGLTELQELRTLQTDEISGYLYSAGLGVSGSAIMEAERKLAAQAEGLYKPRGRNQEINRLLKELEGLEQSLRRSKDHAADYDRLQEERCSAEERVAALEQRQDALRAELHKLSLAGKARSGWIRLRQVGQELAALPALASFPEHASARLEALEAELERAEAERTRLTIKQLGLRSQLQALDLAPEVLARQIELNDMLEQASSYEENKRSVVELRVEQDHLRVELDKLLSQIDERWEERTLAAFPVSISLREQVRSYKDKFQDCRVEELRARTELESLRQQRVRVQDNVQSLELDLHRKGIRTDTIRTIKEGEADGGALQHVARNYARWQLLLRDAQHYKERQAEQRQHQLLLDEAAAQSRRTSRRNQQRLVVITSLLTVIGPAWLLWQKNGGAALLTFVLLAGVSLYILLSGRQTSVKRSARALTSETVTRGAVNFSSELLRVEEELQQLERVLQQQVEEQFVREQQAFRETAAASELHKRGHTFPLQELQSQLDVWLREAELWKQQRGELQRKLEKLLDAKETRQILQDQEDEQNEVLQEKRGELEQLQTEWRVWLHTLELSTQLSPDAALETIQAVEKGHEWLRQLHKLATKLVTLEASIDLFEKRIADLLGMDTQKGNEPLLALKRWKEQEQKQLLLLAEQQHCEQLSRDGEQELLVLQEAKQRIQTRLSELFVEASAPDGEVLRQNQSQQERRMRLIEEQKVLQASLESLIGSSSLASFLEILDVQGEEDMALSLQSLEDERLKAAEEANGLRTEVGKLTGEIEKLELGFEHADQLLQAEAFKASIKKQVDQYAIASFATQLLRKARDVYERERQPGVLLKASSYFEKMTNGKWVQIRAPFGEQRLVAIRANGQSLDTNSLSRGTAEQLYLSMRFALVEEYAGKAILPLVMDDILVNFDEERMESCLRVIADVSSRHQVLLFTCHSHVRDAASRILPGHRLIEL
ncbi:AAA family ATPase [Paenibacillus sp. SYP-B3998]|uniref:AAA family ATPase n=1 Tax=Paenibacillus sp. SYP-B3998 TaxID=2678564 RepID=A0A6G4A4B9_9BACL|nr:AAA family ATPase [Paenibacillus sp. SYP-B3998]NEW08659.1 AAA family ATPase [Paenibacillus sp. SYP-B3998]